MSLFIASVNSGSNANCYYIGNDQEAVLIDAGLSCRETEKRMKGLGLSMDKVKAIFVSHEHSDHITGVPGLSKKYQLPVYITGLTYKNSNIPLQEALVRSFSHIEEIRIGSMTVVPFAKHHDAADPYSFIIRSGELTAGVMTDIGHVCKNVLGYFKECDAVFLEANYCPDMLEKGSYPYHLKKRISGDKGHLSNLQALDLFRQHRSPALQLLVLSHLSKNNNRPELVEKLFTPYAGTIQIVVAPRYAASEVYRIEAGKEVKCQPKTIARKRKDNHELQLRLF